MKPLEYLLDNITAKYTIFPGMLGYRTYIENGYNICEFLNSGDVDGAILRGWPSSWKYLHTNFMQMFAIQLYIQKEVMMRMINSAEIPQTKTELVKLRIAVNKILGLTFLSKEEKLAWSQWVQELYWERKKILHRWYLEYILPF